jgi:TPR repeat protein
MDEDSYKAGGYAVALEERRKDKEPSGAFYFGVYNWRICGGMQSVDKGQLGDAVKNCWLESFESFKLASTTGIPAASFNIARMYENGWGVMPSKLVAAEWFVKAADQYNKDGSRDEALASVEAALNSVPDHPAALKLRSAMLK